MRPDLTVFFGCLYYATMRPGEAVSPRQTDCVSLPDEGRALLLLTGNAPRVGSAWTDSGNAHDERHLKHRAKKFTRPVPVPPDLVTLRRAHLHAYGTAPDGRLFYGRRGAMLGESVYGRIWQQARSALTQAQVASPLATLVSKDLKGNLAVEQTDHCLICLAASPSAGDSVPRLSSARRPASSTSATPTPCARTGT